MEVKRRKTILHSDSGSASSSGGWTRQGVLNGASSDAGELKAEIAGESGYALLFVSDGSQECPVWHPVKLKIICCEPEAIRKNWTPPGRFAYDIARWQNG